LSGSPLLGASSSRVTTKKGMSLGGHR
jgi:hypothetical protein